MPNFIKIRPVGAEFYEEGKTYGQDEASSRFSEFCESA